MAGGRLLQRGGHGGECSKPPLPLAVGPGGGVPEREMPYRLCWEVWGGVGPGEGATPTPVAQNTPHIVLITLTLHMCGDMLLVEHPLYQSLSHFGANVLGLAAEIELGLGLVLEAAAMHMQGIGMLVPSTHTSFLMRHRTTLFINRACVHSVARLRKSLQSDLVVCAEDTNMPTNGFSCANLTQSHATYMDTTRPICLLHSHPDCCSASSSNTRHNAPAFTPNYPSAVLRLLRPNYAHHFHCLLSM